jgi:agmatine deiminase
VLWLPGLVGQDITDDHIDGLARFVRTGLPAHVVVDQPADPRASDVWAVSERQSLKLLAGMKDAHGRRLSCLTSRESRTIPAGETPSLFVNVYVNWYTCNGAVLLPAFGDRKADGAARSLVAELYPGRDVVQMRIDTLAEGGGGIHCVTQQEPAGNHWPVV